MTAKAFAFIGQSVDTGMSLLLSTWGQEQGLLANAKYQQQMRRCTHLIGWESSPSGSKVGRLFQSKNLCNIQKGTKENKSVRDHVRRLLAEMLAKKLTPK